MLRQALSRAVAFNSLFEMPGPAERLAEPPAPSPFNSLFEMHMLAEVALEVAVEPFNSLFEMPLGPPPSALGGDLHVLSILYLRCRSSATAEAVRSAPSFQFSI